MPPSQLLNPGKQLVPSRYVTSAFTKASVQERATILDLPAGTGRHSAWLVERGYRVTVADIDVSLVRQTTERLGARSHVHGVVVDAAQDLPFHDQSFDGALIVDFVHANLLRDIGRVICSGGFLIYESYSDRGQNWRELLPTGATVAILQPSFDILDVQTRRAGPAGSSTETVKLLARRRVKWPKCSC